LISLAALMAWFLTYAFVLTPLQARHDQSVLYSQLREELAAETAPLGGNIKPGSPIAAMDMPTAGIHREVVVEGTSSSNLTAGPGHLRDSVLPGQPGTSIVMGRATLFGGPFASIAKVHPGSEITFTTGEGVAEYVVLDIRHAGDPGPAPLASGAGGLLLVTSDSSGWRSGWAPTRAVFVDAKLVGTPFGTKSGGPSSVPTAELPMKGDGAALYVLLLWLPLLLAAAVVVSWAFARWGRWQAWVIGVPLLLATLWGVSKVAVQLLPNLT
jgi:sortase A